MDKTVRFYSGKRNKVPRRLDKTVRFYTYKRNKVPKRLDKTVRFYSGKRNKVPRRVNRGFRRGKLVVWMCCGGWRNPDGHRVDANILFAVLIKDG